MAWHGMSEACYLQEWTAVLLTQWHCATLESVKYNDRKLDGPPCMMDKYGCLHEDTVQAVKIFTKYSSKGFEKRQW